MQNLIFYNFIEVLCMIDDKKVKELMDLYEIKTYMELANKCGLPYSTLIYMVSGHDVYASNLCQLSKFFKVPVDTLILKPYHLETVSEKGVKGYDTTNILDSISVKEITLNL